MVVKRLAIAGVAACLMLSLVACKGEEKPPPAERPVAVPLEHLWAVVGNAAMMANPEYRFLMEGSELASLSGGYEFQFTGVASPPEIRPFISFGSPFKLRLGLAGEVRDVSRMRPTGLTAAIAEFGSGVQRSSGAEVLRNIDPGTMVTALIEFKEPKTEKSLGLEDGPAEDIFLSRKRAGARPLYWPGHEGCSSKGLAEPCIDYSSVSQFRSWVSQLTSADEPVLNEFGLNIADLRRAAGDGLIYGIIVDVSPYGLRQRLKKGNVQAVWVAEARTCRRKKDCP